MPFTFLKVDAQTRSGLSDAVFDLYDASGLIASGVSDTMGRVDMGALLPGMYRLSERTPPVGYDPNPTIHSVLVTPVGGITVDGAAAATFVAANIHSAEIPMPPPPTVNILLNTFFEGDPEVTGYGTPGFHISITFEYGVPFLPSQFVQIDTVVLPDGTWSVELPQDFSPSAGDVITVVQSFGGVPQGEPVSTVVEPPLVLFSVAYNANGGTGSFMDGDILEGSEYMIRTAYETGISLPLFTLANWNTFPDGTGVAYLSGDIIAVTGDLTLYAQWLSDTRTVTGLVSPVVYDDLGLGPAFMTGFNTAVELRSSFSTPAPASLTVVVAPIDATGGGEFILNGVPYGSYILYIKRPGYLARSLPVTVSPGDPAITALAPPDGATFMLWAGDVNDDGTVDADDDAIISDLFDVEAGDANYLPAADLNADGIIDNEDLLLAISNAGLTAQDYPGAATA